MNRFVVFSKEFYHFNCIGRIFIESNQKGHIPNLWPWWSKNPSGGLLRIYHVRFEMMGNRSFDATCQILNVNVNEVSDFCKKSGKRVHFLHWKWAKFFRFDNQETCHYIASTNFATTCPHPMNIFINLWSFNSLECSLVGEYVVFRVQPLDFKFSLCDFSVSMALNAQFQSKAHSIRLLSLNDTEWMSLRFGRFVFHEAQIMA